MANMAQIGNALETGNGVYKGNPLFVLADGQVVDFDGKEVAPASAYGKAFYDNFVGYAPNANPTATVRGGVLAAAKGVGDTVPCKIGTDGKLYVPTYPYFMDAFMVDVDSVESALPTLYVDDDLWVDEGAAKIYKATSSAWVEITANKVVEATAAPTVYVVGDFFVKQNEGADELFVQTANAWVAHVGTFSEAETAPETPTDGDYYYNTTSSKLFKYVTDAWVEVTDNQVVRAETAPVIYVNGDYFLDTDTSDKLYKLVTGSWVEQTTMQHIYQATAPLFYADGYIVADQSTKKVYTKDETWGDGVAMAAGKLYTDGTDIYVFGSGSLAKI